MTVQLVHNIIHLVTEEEEREIILPGILLIINPISEKLGKWISVIVSIFSRIVSLIKMKMKQKSIIHGILFLCGVNIIYLDLYFISYLFHFISQPNTFIREIFGFLFYYFLIPGSWKFCLIFS